MQNRSHPYFIDRSICYASRCLLDQISKGHKINSYELLPVYTICFMNFEEPQLSKFRTDVVLADKDNGNVISDKMRFIYLVLPYFNKRQDECSKDFEKWLYVLKHMEALERMPFTAQKEIFKRLADYADSHSLNSEEQKQYEESLFKAMDTEACLMGARLEGLAEGRAEGRAEGLKEQAVKIAINMKKSGMSIAMIANCTGLSENEIEGLN